MDSHLAVFGEIAERMIGPAADFDMADFAGRQGAPFAVDDGEVMIGERPSYGAKTALLAGNGSDPADLAGAIALRDANPEFLLEPLPFVEQQGRRARCNKAERGQRILFELGALAARRMEAVRAKIQDS